VVEEGTAMGYRLTALIGDRRALAEVAAELPAARVVEVGAGLSLLPLTEPVLGQVPASLPGAPPQGFDSLAPGLADLAARCSTVGPLLYVEAETWAGPGSQAAVAWRDGRVSFGPVLTQDAEEGREADGFVTVDLLRDRAVNRGLRHLGVRLAQDGPGDDADEFDVVGLGPPKGRRSTEDWA
jgi:hypothetical protein